MKRCEYLIKRQYKGESEEVVFRTTRKQEVEREFNRIVRNHKSDRMSSVELVRTGYVIITTYGTFGEVCAEWWICSVPAGQKC